MGVGEISFWGRFLFGGKGRWCEEGEGEGGVGIRGRKGGAKRRKRVSEKLECEGKREWEREEGNGEIEG